MCGKGSSQKGRSLERACFHLRYEHHLQSWIDNVSMIKIEAHIPRPLDTGDISDREKDRINRRQAAKLERNERDRARCASETEEKRLFHRGGILSLLSLPILG